MVPSRRSFLQAALGAAQPQTPNIVLILADDMGYSDLNCYGSEIDTPNIDALARRGVRFTQFYNTARCCPTRASLLTGLYSHQAGIGHMTDQLGTPSYAGSLDDRCVTLAQVLSSAGYHCTISGKWHVCPPAEAHRRNWPLQRGFARWFGTFAGGGNYFRPGPLYLDNDRIQPVEGYYTDMIADRSVEFLEASARTGRPYFHYAAFTAPHWPLNAPDDELRRYRDVYKEGWTRIRRRRHEKQLKLGLLDPRWKLSPRDERVGEWAGAGDKDWQSARMAAHAAMVTRLDRNVGRIVEQVRRNGQLDNTVFLFLSDNGASAELLNQWRPGVYVPPGSGKGGNIVGEMPGPATTYQSFGPDWAHVSNTPFRRHKMWVHEGGISTPLIAAWGSRLQGGSLHHGQGHVIDLMPTLAQLGGARYPAGKTPLEGRSLVAAMRGGPKQERPPLFWEHEGNRAVRDGGWKLVSAHNGPWELYDMEADRTETTDLAAAQPDRAARLRATYDAWTQRCGVEPWDAIRKGASAPRTVPAGNSPAAASKPGN